MKEFVKKMHALDGRYTVAELFADFLTLSANSLANHCDWQFFAKREQEVLRIQAKYDERTLQTFSELLAMLMHKEVATEQKFELLEKRVSQLEDNTRQLKNKLYTEIYAWKHNRKEALEKLDAFAEILKKYSPAMRVMITLRNLAHLCIVLWTVGRLFSWLFS